jgi:hypothetical protein
VGLALAAAIPASTCGAVPSTLPRFTIDAGGGRSAGGGFTITGTIGQSDAEPLQPARGGAFTLVSGFWGVAASLPAPGGAIFRDGFEG